VSPAALTVIGTVVSIAGLALVVKPTGVGGLDILGVVFALTAAVCVAGYFLIAARPTGELPPVVLICCGLFVGAAVLAVIGGTGLVPFSFSFEPVSLLGADGVWWIVPMGVVVIVATAFAYLTGILSAAKLGSRVASFIGLLEVLFAILFAWWLLGEVPTLLQALGGALIVAGIVLVKMEREPAGSRRADPAERIRDDQLAPLP
jgi:drug/metabolite transporter (DMT)-like permease